MFGSTGKRVLPAWSDGTFVFEATYEQYLQGTNSFLLDSDNADSKILCEKILIGELLNETL